MYGRSLYGRQSYGAAQADAPVNPEEYFVDLARYSPPFMAELREMAQIYRTQGYEVGYLEYVFQDIMLQFFVTTATWGLTRWETEFGVTTNMSLSYEQRREILKAKIRGQGTTTIAMIREVAAAFSGGEVEVIEDNPNNRFIVQFVGIKGIPRNMNAFISMLEDIKPAHLVYEFQYRYTIWKEMQTYTWGGLKGMVWNDVRTLKEA